jgi:hypothetical protein
VFGGIVAGLMMVMVLIFAFRVYDLERKEIEQTTGQVQLQKERSDAAASNSRVPADIADAQKEADAAASTDHEGATRAAFYWAFGIFSFIFLGVQIVGIYIAYAFDFASDEGAQAYWEIKRAQFNSTEDYRAFYSSELLRIPSVAQDTLAVLQEDIKSRSANMNLSPEIHKALAERSHKTFKAYLERSRTALEAPAAPVAEAGIRSSADELNVLVQQANGEQEILRLSWMQLKERVASGELAADRVSVQAPGERKFLAYRKYYAQAA